MSVKPPEEEKGIFKRKKTTEPVMVFSFSAEEVAGKETRWKAKDDRKISDATHKDDYVAAPGDEESNSGVFLPEGKENLDVSQWNQSRNLYKKQESGGQLSVNHIMEKVISPLCMHKL